MSVSSIAKQQSSIGVHSNHLKLGIIGTANVGKSSLFNVLVDRENRKSPSENCLFRTIDPYIASFSPYDPVIDYVSDHLNISAVPASLTVVDTAGLVEGSFREVSDQYFTVSANQIYNKSTPSLHMRGFMLTGTRGGSIDPVFASKC